MTLSICTSIQSANAPTGGACRVSGSCPPDAHLSSESTKHHHHRVRPTSVTTLFCDRRSITTRQGKMAIMAFAILMLGYPVQADAFSTYFSTFLGIRLRGGSSSTSSSTSSTASSISTNHKGMFPHTMAEDKLTCVMQTPPGAVPDVVAFSENGDKNERKNGKLGSTSTPNHRFRMPNGRLRNGSDDARVSQRGGGTWGTQQSKQPLEAKNGFGGDQVEGDVNGDSDIFKNPMNVDASRLPIDGHRRVHVADPGLVEPPKAVPVDYIAETKLPTELGLFHLRAYRVRSDDKENDSFLKTYLSNFNHEPCVLYAPLKTPLNSDQPVPVRLHDQCLTSEVFGSQRCDCREQLQMALKYIQDFGGCIIYLQQEGRGIGLANKVAAYALQDQGMDTVDANLYLGFPEDMRDYGVVPSILDEMGITGGIKLLTNNPRKVAILRKLGVHVESTLPMVVPETNPYNHRYMETKRTRMNHSNLSELLQPKRSPNDGAETLAINGAMAPRKRMANPTETKNETKNSSLKMSLMVGGGGQEQYENVNDGLEELGVTAQDDGYCFGKESVEKAVDAISRGEIVVVVDDMDRENEGDFIMAADKCKPEDMATIVRYSSGVVCIAMEGQRMDELGLPPMLHNNQDPKGTAFSVTVDATKENGITTGISAVDRSKTVRLLADPSSSEEDFHRPGHIFPLRARPGGVLERDGHTEAAVDLAKLAKCQPAGVLCEIVSEDNPVEMMRLPELKRFCRRHGFVLTSIVDIAQYRRELLEQ